MDGMGGMGPVDWLVATSIVEDDPQPQRKQVAPNKAFGREVSKVDKVPELGLRLFTYSTRNKDNSRTLTTYYVDKLPRFIKRYLGKRYLQRRDNYLKNCIRAHYFVNQFTNNTGISSQTKSTGSLRQAWTNWATHQFVEYKGYAPSVAKFMADRALTQCDSHYSELELMVNTTPMNPQSAYRELQEQNFQWAMRDFTVKGYDLKASREAIAEALNTPGSDSAKFQHWVNQKVSPIPGKANQLRPWVIEQIERKGFSTEEAQATADNLIKKSGGNVDLLCQSVNNIHPRGVPRTLSAKQMQEKNAFSLKVLGLGISNDLKDVDKAYNILAPRYDPARNPNNIEENTKIFQLLTEAHRHLTQDSDLFKS
ncbi:J domain-containing protein [Salinisphaera sp. G21_0]|uniref:J domain-containing protein n=1 Tax=Salinisphaera sp. G21_0 TaxID=2821094 RepID=UPI001AD9A4B6|nr:J domain-containing protein [Salinisphaera sp. G21_0]MBO9483946.1 J domain-containing protein [Salinisphaera sp. G21_0]